MNEQVVVKNLKGGSLSSTVLMTDQTTSWVRKSVKLVGNREFGFDRWYSQLKLLRHYSIMFPKLFPKVIRYGVGEDSIAYMDLEVWPTTSTAFDYLTGVISSEERVRRMFCMIMNKLEWVHSRCFPSNQKCIELYVAEKIVRKLQICMNDPIFKEFADRDQISYNGIFVPSFVSVLDKYTDMLQDCYTEDFECIVHGNITLENILYDPGSGSVLFIDPYAEGIIDSRLVEYSQLLQSCNSMYEILNREDFEFSVDIGCVANHPDSEFEYLGLRLFRDHLINFLWSSLSNEQIRCVQLFEISQYIRMLPFKLKSGKIGRTILFYGLASWLFSKLLDGALLSDVGEKK